MLELGPGMSSYQPMLRPHWVRCHGEVSVSIGFSLYTRAGEDRRVVHAVNRRMRRLGLDPAPPGSGADGAKRLVGGVLRGAASLLRGGRGA